ncbi:MAG: peptidylprolyl isomerase [Fusobacteria bacterium]|nr:peptidylprolyl isomerase [Fusobacteriota bacterium]
MKKNLVVLFAASLLLFTACGETENNSNSKKNSNQKNEVSNSVVLKKFGKLEITEKELNDELKNVPSQYKAYYESEMGRNNLIERIALGKMFEAEALAEGVEKTSDFKTEWEKTKNKFLISYYINKKLNEIEIKDSELEIEYEKNKENFKRNEEVKASHILLTVNVQEPQESKEEKLNKITEIFNDIKEGKISFEDAAKEYSGCPSSKNGGDLGWFERNKMVAEFEAAAFSGEIGLYPQIVETQFGYHLINIIDKKPEGYIPFEELKEGLKEDILEKRKGERYREWEKELRDKYKEEKKEEIEK